MKYKRRLLALAFITTFVLGGTVGYTDISKADESWKESLWVAISSGRTIGVCQATIVVASNLDQKPKRAQRDLYDRFVNHYADKEETTPQKYLDTCAQNLVGAIEIADMLKPMPEIEANRLLEIDENSKKWLKRLVATGRAIGVCEVLGILTSNLDEHPKKSQRDLYNRFVRHYADKAGQTPRQFAKSCVRKLNEADKVREKLKPRQSDEQLAVGESVQSEHEK